MECGADINKLNKKFFKPLSIAILHKKYDIVKYLTGHGTVKNSFKKRIFQRIKKILKLMKRLLVCIYLCFCILFYYCFGVCLWGYIYYLDE